MTLPTETQLPLDKDLIESEDSKDNYEYMRQLVRKLEDLYENITEEINGSLQDFTPILKDTATDTTYTYVNRVAWYLRQNLIVDVWFDIEWSAIDTGTPTGNLYLELPYEVLNTTRMPFVGVVQASGIDFGTNLTQITINAIPSTFRGEFWGSGSTQTMLNIPANTSSGRLMGHVRYPGEEFEG